MKVLDLFCGAGGSAMGIHQALEEVNIEHEIIGIDNREMPDYPFNFIKSDVFDDSCFPNYYDMFDFIWASPPCQAWVDCNHDRSDKPRLIKPTREILEKTDKPYIIENVELAPIRHDLMLCGKMFNLGVFRHRFFESNFPIIQPIHPKHKGYIGDGKHFTVITGGAFRDKRHILARAKIKNYDYGSYESWSKAMGIDWIRLEWTDHKRRKPKYKKNIGLVLPSGHPLAEAIPPAYSKYIIQQFLLNHPTLDKWIEVDT